MQRNFLFLQGPCTYFFSALADHLKSLGHSVSRINFCGGDVVFWGNRPSINYRARPEKLNQFLGEIYQEHNITDQILFGDCRPVHRQAINLAKTNHIRNHVFEEGHFRPHWITLEREGTNRHSLLPRNINWFCDAAQGISEIQKPVAFHSAFSKRAFQDVIYHIAGLANPVLFPGYRTHASITAPIEYAGYIRRFSLLRCLRKKEEARIAKLLASQQPFFFLPLQLNTDAQIREHSPFSNMKEVIEQVSLSFATYAPKDCLLVIKNHPLDMGLMNYPKIIRKISTQLGIGNRLIYLEQGNLQTLSQHAKGVITVNSTSGFVALKQGKPTIALGDPVYNLPKLTFQGNLDDFWLNPVPPNPYTFECFQRVVLYCTQINGGFYCRSGIRLAVENSAKLLISERSRLEEIL